MGVTPFQYPSATFSRLIAPCDHHIAQVTSRAFQRVNLIFRTFTSRDVSHLLQAYCTLCQTVAGVK